MGILRFGNRMAFRICMLVINVLFVQFYILYIPAIVFLTDVSLFHDYNHYSCECLTIICFYFISIYFIILVCLMLISSGIVANEEFSLLSSSISGLFYVLLACSHQKSIISLFFRLLLFLPAILVPVSISSNPGFLLHITKETVWYCLGTLIS